MLLTPTRLVLGVLGWVCMKVVWGSVGSIWTSIVGSGWYGAKERGMVVTEPQTRLVACA